MLIPLIAATMSLQLFSMLPMSVPGGQPLLTLLLMYIVTYLYAKFFKCWKSSKRIWARSFVPILIFVAWLMAFYFPLTAPIMIAIGKPKMALPKRGQRTATNMMKKSSRGK